MFYNPTVYNILPYKHNFNATEETVYTGFFIPAYRIHFGFLDDRGVTDEVKARAVLTKSREDKRSDFKAYMEFCSEYCFTPEDALIRQGENQFNQEILAEQLAQLLVHKTVTLPTRGFLSYISPTNEDQGLKWRPSANGDILVLEEPLRDDKGQVFRNLYVAGIDAIDLGTEDSTGQKDVSDFCIVIKRRLYGLREPQYVAIYKCRPKDIRMAYGNAMRLLEWYNCSAVLEATRINFKEYLRKKNKLHLLMKRPKSTMTTSGGKNTNLYGAPATEHTITHYLELIEHFVNDYGHTINYEEMLNQLLKYNYKTKRKYDIVASLGMCELADEELYTKPIVSATKYRDEWKDIGYFTDSMGHKHYGEIPNNEELKSYHLKYDFNRF